MQYLKDEIKNSITMAALNEFEEKGFRGASMRTIAKQAGIATGNIYRYFDGKDELFDFIMEPVYQQFFELIDDQYKTIEVSNDIIPTVADIVDRIMKVYEKYSREFMILLDKSQGSKYQDIKEDLIMLIDDRIKKEILPRLSEEKIIVDDELIIYVAAGTFVEGIITIFRNCRNDFARIKNLISQLLLLYLNYTDIIAKTRKTGSVE